MRKGELPRASIFRSTVRLHDDGGRKTTRILASIPYNTVPCVCMLILIQQVYVYVTSIAAIILQ